MKRLVVGLIFCVTGSMFSMQRSTQQSSLIMRSLAFASNASIIKKYRVDGKSENNSLGTKIEKLHHRKKHLKQVDACLVKAHNYLHDADSVMESSGVHTDKTLILTALEAVTREIFKAEELIKIENKLAKIPQKKD